MAVDPGGRFIVGSGNVDPSVFRADGTYSHAFKGWHGYSTAVDAGASAKIASARYYAFIVGYANGTIVTSRHSEGIYDGQIGGFVGGIAFDNADWLVVSDYKNDRIQVFRPDGEFAAKFGRHGDADGEFYRLRGIAVSPLDGRIAVSDYGNSRIQVFAPLAYDEGGDGSPHHRQQHSLQPTVTAVSSPQPRGVYGAGDVIQLNVHFTRPVHLLGQPPTLALDTGAPSTRNATYAGGNGTAILKFSYTVHPHDYALDLEYASSDALTASGTYAATGMSGLDVANLTLPAPGTPGSLAYCLRRKDLTPFMQIF